MPRKNTYSLVFLAIAAVAAGCGPVDSAEELLKPSIGAGKGEMAVGAVIGPQWIVVGETKPGKFTANFQFFGYKFRGAAGAEISVKVERTTGTGRLDSTLFVHGPGLGASSPELAFDDNSGYGNLSWIKSLPLPEDGTYLIVVGTPHGRGRGNFDLALTCKNTACLPTDEPIACNAFNDVVHDCVSETLNEYDYDDCWTAPCMTEDDIDVAFEYCTSDGYVDTLRESVCGWHDPPTPAWCAEPIADFIASRWPSCKSQLEKPTIDDFTWDPD